VIYIGLTDVGAVLWRFPGFTTRDRFRQALKSLGFGTDIYYMLGHLGWVQFSNGVSANTRKEFSLEILMTMAPILDEGLCDAPGFQSGPLTLIVQSNALTLVKRRST
jgi:hypothetical protein